MLGPISSLPHLAMPQRLFPGRLRPGYRLNTPDVGIGSTAIEVMVGGASFCEPAALFSLLYIPYGFYGSIYRCLALALAQNSFSHTRLRGAFTAYALAGMISPLELPLSMLF
ncbi:hypothetical protein MCOR25_004058 [Pyricularia grisea]|uniref:Uncharacterized protein n=1 Tax=Pyricularia grisea TaxID=148305 RepID=A0A6P8ASA2_PYRGI|nr:uncharacterized protein PgNI_09516 [Pyricularia grisea]KAI6370925.1 hypothetical protein MCOR25_004058 [Pyricularia grisea]TLD05004.1 hypothetical protein PgNI_09516 [Pyricularia grisea]